MDAQGWYELVVGTALLVWLWVVAVTMCFVLVVLFVGLYLVVLLVGLYLAVSCRRSFCFSTFMMSIAVAMPMRRVRSLSRVSSLLAR